jgi:hypothetical protein
MQNNHTYFALKVEANGTLRKEYPKQVYPFVYQGLELFCYLASIGQWNTVEKTTGLPIAISEFSKIDCTKQAREKINKDGAIKVINDIKLARGALSQMNIYEANDE